MKKKVYNFYFEPIEDDWERVLIYDIETVSSMEELDRARKEETYEYLDVCEKARHICFAVRKDVIASNRQIITNKILKKYTRSEYQDYYIYLGMNMTAEQMAEDLLRICLNYGLNLLSHNGLRFDFLIFKHLIDRGEVTHQEMRHNHFLRKGNTYIRLIDSYAITSASLEASCEKYHIPMRKLHDSDLSEYLRNDVYMLIELVKAFQQTGMKYTPTRTARHFYHQIASERGITAIRTYIPPDMEMEYIGGRCEVWKAHAENVRQYDVNSMYPYVMSHFSYPKLHERKNEYHIYIREASEREKEAFSRYIDAMRDLYISYMKEGENIVEMKKLLDLKRVYYYARVKIRRIHPSLRQYEHIIMRYFPFSFLSRSGRRVYAWKPDTEYFIEGYELSFLSFFEYDLISLYLSEAEKLFTADLIQRMYEERRQAKASGDTARAEYLKSILVSMYGMFGLRHEYTRQTTYTSEEKHLLQHDLLPYRHAEEIHSIIRLTSPSRTATLVPSPDAYTLTENIRDFSTHMSAPPLATATTSHSRFWLLLHIYHITMNLNGNVFYCDTDSIFTDATLPESDQLGGWKLENVYEKAYWFLPKTYAVCTGEDWKVKAKGIGRSFITERPTQSFRTNFSVIRKLAFATDRTVQKRLLPDFWLEYTPEEKDFFTEFLPLLSHAISHLPPPHSTDLSSILTTATSPSPSTSL